MDPTSKIQSSSRTQLPPYTRSPSLVDLSQVAQQSLFAAPAFDSYLLQLKEFVEKECETKELELAQRVLNFSPNTPQGNCEFYRQWIYGLRQLSQEIEAKIDFANKVCRWMYRSPRLLESMMEMVCKYVPEEIKSDEVIEPERFKDIFTKTYQKTLEDPEFTSHSVLESMHDPHGLGNIPYYLCTLAGVRMIRMPNVLRDVDQGQEVKSTADFHVIEEFYRYLSTLKDKGKVHLYINLLSRVKHQEGKIMVQKIAELESDPLFENRLFVVALDKDSDFYWQRGDYAEDMSQKVFKRAFLDFLFDTTDQGAFLWSAKMDLQSWKESCKEVIEEVSKNYFEGKKILDLSCRQDFIEITYSRLIAQLFSLFKATSCNITCKHSADRGPSVFSLLYIDQRHKKQQKILGKDLMRLMALILQQPLLLQNRPAHDYRVNRLLSAAMRIMSVKPV